MTSFTPKFRAPNRSTIARLTLVRRPADAVAEEEVERLVNATRDPGSSAQLRAANEQLVLSLGRSHALLGDALTARDEAIASTAVAQAECALIQKTVVALRSVNARRDESLSLLGADLCATLAPILRAVDSMRLQANDTCRFEREVIERGARQLLAVIDEAAEAKATSRAIV